MEAEVSPKIADGFEGADGKSDVTDTANEAEDSPEFPASLIAWTVKVYEVAASRPETVQEVVAVLQVNDSGVDVTT